MDQQSRRPRRKRRNTNQMLMVIIAILVVILIAVVLIAIFTKPETNPKPDNTNGTGGSDSTQGTVEDTKPVPQGLTITEPAKQNLVVVDNSLVFRGTADPKEGILIGDTVVPRNEDGSFAYTVTLKTGMNEIPVTYRGETVVYQVEYRYVIQNFFPNKEAAFNSGATVQVEVFARKGSSLTVTLGNQTISVKEDPNQIGSGIAEGFVRYSGTYQMPTGNTEDQTLGQFTFTGTCDGVTETYQSGTITCLKMAEILTSDPSVTPDYGDYMDVGSGYIVEIVNYNAETFDGHTTDDNSDPRRNYLPKGTVDYCKQEPLLANKVEYMVMRCGRRVYTKSNNWPDKGKVKVVDCYRGTLPDHNELGFAGIIQSGHHTIITFDSLWKAPFYFDLGPQEYLDPSDRDFRVTQLTAEYVDITFCYTTKFEGTVTIPATNPLFESAELKQNVFDCTLRLKLKKTGGFYGWDAYYNENDQLCFRFLNPVKATAGDNAYGADLTGIRIMIDVGHGGIDDGAYMTMGDGSEIHEDDLNLELAMRLKEKLESMGATVLINRTADVNLNVHERIQWMVQQAPDMCIAIHQNSAPSYPNTSGAHIMHFTPFSQKLAQYLYENTAATGIYKPGRVFLEWSVYFMSRQTTCPVVLTENGFMSNSTDFPNMLNPTMVDKKADAMAQAIATYFLQNG